MIIYWSWIKYILVIGGLGCMYRGISDGEPGTFILGLLMAAGGGYWIYWHFSLGSGTNRTRKNISNTYSSTPPPTVPNNTTSNAYSNTPSPTVSNNARSNTNTSVPPPTVPNYGNVFCPSCGNSLARDMSFCNKCGTKVR